MVLKTTTALAEKLDITLPTIINWRKRGMPFIKTGPSSYSYDFKKVLSWLKENPGYKDWIDQMKKDGKI